MKQPGLGWPSTFCAAMALLSLCGCQIPNRLYRPVALAPQTDKSAITVPEPPHLPMPPKAAWPPHPEPACNHNDLLNRPCLAFLEFDDFGETWQKNPSGRPSQLQRIIDLIGEAIQQDPRGEPLILTFVHGWKHNASEGKKSGDDDSNIIGVEAVLNELHEVTWRGHVVIGIYVAWRGGLISPYWPVSQQFTYWNREATAARVGNASLTEALIEISDAAQATDACKQGSACYSVCGGKPSVPCSPRLLFVGHSFGALVLERALSQAIVTRMENEWMEAKKASEPLSPNIEPLATLVIYVNSAAAAIESKQLMDYLASSHFLYRPLADGTDQGLEKPKNQPLFLSVTSEADYATGLLLKVGHAVPLLNYELKGSMRGKSSGSPPSGTPSDQAPTEAYARACFDPAVSETESHIMTDLSQSDYFMSTTAHMQALQSHVVIAKPLPVPLGDVFRCTPGIGKDDPYATCAIGHFEYSIVPAPGRCNGTPYWVMQVQKELVPDHTTIFTDRFITFLTAFFPNPSNPLPRLMKAE